MGDRLGCSLRHNSTTALAALGAQVDEPVDLGKHIQIMLDDDHGVAGGHEPVQHADEFFHIGHVQSHRGFIQKVKRMRRAAAALAGPGLGELRDELEALRFPAGERGARLTEGQVAEARVLEQAQGMLDFAMNAEELGGLGDAQLQHSADGLAAVFDGQGLRRKAQPVTQIAAQGDVRQETHRHPLQALTLAGWATAVLGIKGEAPWAIAAHARLFGLREQAADIIPEADIGGRAGARRFADRALVDFQYPVYRLPAYEVLAVAQRCP
ncbi:hypothetical protein NB231_14133 [Nitrococcus mobilis Nb-231]|uniref:Uncharacterized protein n=1 Tax=Nitrococcus mobilis Nb-231 TaxID=314278 RepID=A4BKX7_9GAMM|nr:hypothetical protein NB231_14133 [Nitrococcus mobilis Nb-231]